MFKNQILQIKKLTLREIKELSFHLRAYQKVMEPGGESSLCVPVLAYTASSRHRRRD